MILQQMSKPIVLLTIALLSTVLFFVIFFENEPYSSSTSSSRNPDSMAPTFILWLHGLGDSGPANEPIKTVFKSPEFRNTKWLFPSAPPNPVSCNCTINLLLVSDFWGIVESNEDHCVSQCLENLKVLANDCAFSSCADGMVMPSWFDIRELPLTAGSPNDESSVLKAVKNVQAIIDKEIAGGISPENVYICGFSQGGGDLSVDLPFSFRIYKSTMCRCSCIATAEQGALALASVLLYPKALGGGAVFSGWVPFSSSTINKFTEDAKKSLFLGVSESFRICIVQTPILWSHGIDDKTVLFEAGQAALPFLQQAGVTCEFKAYPDLGHSISNKELQYLESWIKQRMQSSSSS
ncbi:unnamed protein product [Thlaspi arvense]|uniref:Phospholipase/carboxylesterase/thioesterase domain-containing protein n=1 Tax=Thlaspi arvense TaxID=13288 RepID=A0AAU9T250_THLAR|nr:unnamed protein product [Thlaspi arvense]